MIGDNPAADTALIFRHHKRKFLVIVRQIYNLCPGLPHRRAGKDVPDRQPGEVRLLPLEDTRLYIGGAGHLEQAQGGIRREGVHRPPLNRLGNILRRLLEEGKVRIRLVPLRTDGQSGVPEEVPLSVLKADGSRHALGGGQVPLQHRDVPVHLVPAAVDCQVGPDQQSQGQDQEGGHGRQRPLSHGSSPSSPSASWSRVRRTRSAR